jgi:hypothetical protein
MTCAEARDQMLEADRPDLTAATTSGLSLHLRGCAGCRAAAERILDAERELGRALAAATPGRTPHAAAWAAARRASRRRWVSRAAPLAAAAVLAMVLLGRRADVRRAPPAPTRFASGSDIAVEAPPGRSVAVFRTDNPDIVVIWFF